MAVLLVLMLLSLTLGLSYAMVRSQNTASAIERNADRRMLAREAAMAGMATALRSMHRNTWEGVNSTLTGNLTSWESYSVSFVAGDDRLSGTDADYKYLPYRVTVTSVGTSRDPSDSTQANTHTIKSVLQLVPAATAATPAGWSTATAHTLFQYAPGTFSLYVPFRVEGPVFCNATSMALEDYNWTTDPRDRFFADLAGIPTWRPFDRALSVPNVTGTSIARTLLSKMGLRGTDLTSTTTYASMHGSPQSTYRIYQKGPTYTAVSLTTARNTTFGSTSANPLGLHLCTSDLSVYENVTLVGTLMANGASITIKGAQVRLLPYDLPQLTGQSVPLRLPTVVAQTDLAINKDATADIEGLVNLGGKFTIQTDAQSDRILYYTKDGTTYSGTTAHVIAKDFAIEGRSEWKLSAFWWNLLWTVFDSQDMDDEGIASFPTWLYWWGISPMPRIVFATEDEDVTYHWNAASQSLEDGIYRFKVDPANGEGPGHSWKLIRWIDNPS
jgi:hypothetical protein